MNLKVVSWFILILGLLLVIFVIAGEQKDYPVFVATFYLNGDQLDFESVWEKVPLTRVPQAYRVRWKEIRLSKESSEATQGIMVNIERDSVFRDFDLGWQFFQQKQTEKILIYKKPYGKAKK